MSKPDFTPEQPRDGETVLFCSRAHFPARPFHFFRLSSGETPDSGYSFGRPDGSSGVAPWLALCNSCWGSLEDFGDSNLFELIHDDMVWRGDEPELRYPRVQ